MPRSIVNPRLVDHFGLSFTQEAVDFAIPHLKEDLPLCLDPFLLWSSEKAEYQELHGQLVVFFDRLRQLVHAGRLAEAKSLLLRCEEPRELGLGYALGSKRGSAIGPKLATELLTTYSHIPQLKDRGFQHIEEVQLLVPGIAEDRISDVTAAVLKHYFMKFTADRARSLGIPMKRFVLPNVYNHAASVWRLRVEAELPYNPIDGSPLLFAPLDLLRHLPWINYEDYYNSAFAPFVLPADHLAQKIRKDAVLAYNQRNYATVQNYVKEKERTAFQCKPDPLFEPLKLETLKQKSSALFATPPGLTNKSDKKYEDLVSDLLSSALYPELEFAASQVRTASGAHIRDLMFYNDGKIEFLKDLRDRHEARQIVFELKNVSRLETEHVNQLHRYLDEEIGHVGVILTRQRPSQAILRNTVDLHSSKRSIILCMDDSDIELMVHLLESGRRPIEVLKKKYVEFTRMLPK